MNETLTSKERRSDVDIAKAICIVLVVVGHYFPDGAPVWYSTFRDWIYSFHMPLFMFLSGFLYALSGKGKSYAAFLWKKVKRLLLPYVLVSVLIILIKMLGQNVMNLDLKNPIGPASFYRILLGPEAAVHLWFILALWWMFVVVRLSDGLEWHIALLAVGLALHYLPHFIPSLTYPHVFCLNYAAGFFVYFMLGAVISDLGWSFSSCRTVCPLAFVMLFAVNSLTGFAAGVSEYIGIAGMAGLAYFISRLPAGAVRPFAVVSEASYAIYLLHSVFIGFTVTAVRMTCPALLDADGRLFWAGALLITVISTVSCVLVKICLKKFTGILLR